MINKIADSVVKYPWVYIVVFLLITAAFGSQVSKAEIDPSIKNQLPTDIQARLNIDKIEDIFGGTDIAMVIFSSDDVLDAKTLKRVKKFSKEMERVKDFDKIMSIFTLKDIKGEDG